MAWLDELPAPQRAWETGWIPDQDGVYAFLAIVRSRDDPERSSREARRARLGHIGARDEWKKIRKLPAKEWLPRIENHLLDGRPRTFNAIMVELADVTADVAMGDDDSEEPSGPLAALWMLVSGKRVEFTMETPVLFRSLDAHAHAERVRRSLGEF
jgi:hypothetical protein